MSKPFPSEANIGAHCTRKFYDKRGGVVAFFDNILSMDELAALRSYLMRYETAYTYNGYIQSEDDDADNVSWMMMLKVSISVLIQQCDKSFKGHYTKQDDICKVEIREARKFPISV